MKKELWKFKEEVDGWRSGREDPHSKDNQTLIEEGHTLYFIKMYRQAREFMRWPEKHLYNTN